MTEARKRIATPADLTAVENFEIAAPVMWAGLLTSGLPCAVLLAVGIIAGELIESVALYGLLVLVYIGLLLLLDIPSQVSRWIWPRLWLYLLVLGLVGLAIQSLIRESFLQPIVFLVPLVYAALAYPAARVAVVAVVYLGLMNLGIWLSGERHPIAFVFPTIGYGTFMFFTYAFTRLSVEQARARRRADALAADLERERDYLARLSQITATLTRDLDLTNVLEQVAATGRAFAHADQARVWLREDTQAGDGAQVQLATAVPPQPQEGVSTTSERWGVGSIQELAASSSGAGLVLPLVSKGATIGVLELHGSPAIPFDDQDVRLLQPFANAAAVAIENARLYEQARFSATLAERNRLARELHDTIAQGLTAVTMQLEAAQRSFERDPARARARLGRAHELAREALEDVRRSVWTLAAPLVDGQTLSQALDELTQRFAERTGIAASYHHDGPTPSLGHAAATQVLRIVQEALQNVEKHAQATQVCVESTLSADELRVQVRDDGVGFEPGAHHSYTDANGNEHGASGRFGLLSLRERARLSGGVLQIESAPEAGTRIAVSIPIERDA
ncbi:MAG TPA: GAF domain-containing sensor histidine kinase [Roseiflexaceae bacterium]|nr:GAF domain-containing sensor histidine kinase [Roseiflexaceae bacterium]